MFNHLFKYRIKVLLKKRSILFWSLAFPIILTTFFKMAFANLDDEFVFKTVPVAIVTDGGDLSQQNQTFKETLVASKNEDKTLFNVKSLSLAEAKSALAKNKIAGYYRLSEKEPVLTISQNGFDQTFLSQFLTEYNQVISGVTYLAETKPQLLSEKVINELSNTDSFTAKKQYSKNAPNSSVIYFFSALAMACMFGMNWGVLNSSDTQANQSPKGIRMVMSPNSKVLVVLTNLLAAFCLFFIEMLLVFGYVNFVLQINFGERIGQIILTLFVSCILSISLGSLIGSAIKDNQKVKQTVVMSISVFGAFLAGMMSPDIKYLVAQKAPWLSYINPTNLVSDSFYKLYYYDSLNTFYLNIGIMLVFVVLFSLGNYAIIRREKYVSL